MATPKAAGESGNSSENPSMSKLDRNFRYYTSLSSLLRSMIKDGHCPLCPDEPGRRGHGQFEFAPTALSGFEMYELRALKHTEHFKHFRKYHPAEHLTLRSGGQLSVPTPSNADDHADASVKQPIEVAGVQVGMSTTESEYESSIASSEESDDDDDPVEWYEYVNGVAGDDGRVFMPFFGPLLYRRLHLLPPLVRRMALMYLFPAHFGFAFGRNNNFPAQAGAQQTSSPKSARSDDSERFSEIRESEEPVHSTEPLREKSDAGHKAPSAPVGTKAGVKAKTTKDTHGSDKLKSGGRKRKADQI